MPSTVESATPVTVTVCAVIQLLPVKVSVSTDTVPSVGTSEATDTVTSAVGSVASRTARLALPPASVVVVPEGVVTTTPAVSSSVLVSAIGAIVRPL